MVNASSTLSTWWAVCSLAHNGDILLRPVDKHWPHDLWKWERGCCSSLCKHTSLCFYCKYFPGGLLMSTFWRRHLPFCLGLAVLKAAKESLFYASYSFQFFNLRCVFGPMIFAIFNVQVHSFGTLWMNLQPQICALCVSVACCLWHKKPSWWDCHTGKSSCSYRSRSSHWVVPFASCFAFSGSSFFFFFNTSSWEDFFSLD